MVKIPLRPPGAATSEEANEAAPTDACLAEYRGQTAPGDPLFAIALPNSPKEAKGGNANQRPRPV